MPRDHGVETLGLGAAVLSSMRSASWTISEISRSTGSPGRTPRETSRRSRRPRGGRAWPRPRRRAQPLGRLSRVPEEVKLGVGVHERRINQMHAVRSTWHPRGWPRALPCVLPPAGPASSFSVRRASRMPCRPPSAGGT